MSSFFQNWHWNSPMNKGVIKVIDMHTGGEPLRIPVRGLPEIVGNTVLEKRRFFSKNYDHIRRRLMYEPRGHADMYGAIISAPSSPDADFDVFFIHNEGYSTMCGHAIIALVKFAFETALVPWRDSGQLVINVPAGKIKAQAIMQGDRVIRSKFENVPSFVLIQNESVHVEGIGNVVFDVAYGGAFYAIVNAQEVGLKLHIDDASRIIDFGRRIKLAVMENFTINHPFEPDLSFLYGTIFVGPPSSDKDHSRNACVFADGELDRSATGSGVSARAALHYHRGELKVEEQIEIESIIGSTMMVAIKKVTKFGEYQAIIPEVSGTAHFSGMSEFYFDPEDPLADGFLIR